MDTGDIVRFIENSLSGEITPEIIAQRHFISVSRLYRDFYACTGHSVKEYIRKRRISNACEKIKYSGLSLAVIAHECGYRTQQAFHRQFKNTVGMTPLAYQQGNTYFYFYPFDTDRASYSVKVCKETIPKCSMTRFYDSCLPGIEDKAVADLSGTAGRVFGRNGKQVGSLFCYEVMTEMHGAGKMDLYATTVVRYDEAEIDDAWNYLYNTWLSASMFEETDGAYFEEYLFQNGRPNKLKLYLPVKKRKAERHITIQARQGYSFVAARERGRDAERKASEKVLSYLQAHDPLLIQSARRFFVSSDGDACMCGVECDSGYQLTGKEGPEVLKIPAGRYAVLPDDRLGDMQLGAEKIRMWLHNNGIAHENEPVFAIYEIADGKYDNEHIHMELYALLKNDKNG